MRAGIIKAQKYPHRPRQVNSQGFSVILIHDPSGLYRRGARFTSKNFKYTAIWGYWPEGAEFLITSAQQRHVRIIAGRAVDIDTGEVLTGRGRIRWSHS